MCRSWPSDRPYNTATRASSSAIASVRSAASWQCADRDAHPVGPLFVVLVDGCEPARELDHSFTKRFVPIGARDRHRLKNVKVEADLGDMIAELQTANVLHRFMQGRIPLARKMLRIASQGGAEVLGWDSLGSLEPGKAAYVVLIDTNQLD